MSLYDSIVITGGNGMLAHAVGDAVRARGLRAVSLGRSAVDVTQASAVGAMFREHKPTLVFNCAAFTRVDDCEQTPDAADAVNGHAVGHLAMMAREYGATLVHFSTDFVFDGKSTRPYRPDDPTNPLSAYGRSKLLGERLLQEHAPDRWLILRTAWLYGRHGQSFPRTMVNAARAGKPVKVVCDQVGTPTFTCDLAAAALEMLDHDLSGLWHLTNAGSTNWHDFARATLKEFAVDADLSSVTSADWFKIRPTSAVRPSYSVLDVEPFAQRVGRPMRHWSEGLSEFHRQVEEAGSF